MVGLPLGYEEIRQPFLHRHQKLRDGLCARHLRKRNELEMIINTAAWRCCGIASEPASVIIAYNTRAPPRSFEFQQVTPIQLIIDCDPGVCTHVCPDSGYKYGKVYVDVSLIHGNSIWRAAASWSIWVNRSNPVNCAGSVTIPCSFRAELVAIAEVSKRAAVPLMIIGDCQGALQMLNEIMQAEDAAAAITR